MNESISCSLNGSLSKKDPKVRIFIFRFFYNSMDIITMCVLSHVKAFPHFERPEAKVTLSYVVHVSNKQQILFGKFPHVGNMVTS
jgi:hypothetical protein